MESSTNENGLKAFETLRSHLQNKGWNASPIEDRHVFKATREDSLVGERDYYFQVKPDLEQFLFYIAPNLLLMPEMLPPVAEFICRANFGMRIGNFELDYEGCKVSFKSSINFKGVPLTEQLIDNVIEPALEAYDEFFTGLVQVFTGVETPARAIRIIEYGDPETWTDDEH